MSQYAPKYDGPNAELFDNSWEQIKSIVDEFKASIDDGFQIRDVATVADSWEEVRQIWYSTSTGPSTPTGLGFLTLSKTRLRRCSSLTSPSPSPLVQRGMQSPDTSRRRTSYALGPHSPKQPS